MMRKNRFYYYWRLVKWKILGDRSPIGASLKITQRCNLRCRHCAWEKNPENERSLPEWKATVDDLYRRGVSVIAIEGGEPTLHPDASDIVAYIREKGIYCIFITNGTGDISGIHPDVFWVSIDGVETSHDEIRGTGVFSRAIQTIQENRDRPVMTLTSLSRSNMHDAEPLCEFLSPLVKGIIFNFTYPYGDIHEEALDAGERRALAAELLSLKGRYPKLLNSDSYLKAVGMEKRFHPWLLITVTSDGNCMQGCMVRHIEAEDCGVCDMGCCAELSQVYALRPDAIRFWVQAFGLPRLF